MKRKPIDWADLVDIADYVAAQACDLRDGAQAHDIRAAVQALEEIAGWAKAGLEVLP